MKMLMILIAVIAFCSGCGPSAYQIARQEIAQQYADLDQIQDLSQRQQKFAEIAQRENILEAQAQADRATRMQLWQEYMAYQALTQPKNYNIRVWGVK